jgi:hypothetical protein
VRALDERFIDPLIGAPARRSNAAAGRSRRRTDPWPWAGRSRAVQLRRPLQRIENHLLLSGDGALGRFLQRAAHYADAIESLLEQPRYLMLMVMATFVVIL